MKGTKTERHDVPDGSFRRRDSEKVKNSPKGEVSRPGCRYRPPASVLFALRLVPMRKFDLNYSSIELCRNFRKT